jgi:hypothetical protein
MPHMLSTVMLSTIPPRLYFPHAENNFPLRQVDLLPKKSCNQGDVQGFFVEPPFKIVVGSDR